MDIRTQMVSLIDNMLNGRILLSEAMAEFEKLYIQKALERSNDHLSNTAQTLGIHRNTLSKKVAGYQPASSTPKKLVSRRAKS